MNRKKFPFCLSLACLSVLLILSGCYIPRIIVFEDPLKAEEHLNLGMAYEKRGEYEAAVKEYKIAAKTFNIANLYLGNIYFEQHELDQAELFYKKAIEHDPILADAYNNLAWLYYEKKENLDVAESLALKAIEIQQTESGNYKDTLGKIRLLRKERISK
jgi:tetratricopeptide (TPR) repeat protein